MLRRIILQVHSLVVAHFNPPVKHLIWNLKRSWINSNVMFRQSQLENMTLSRKKDSGFVKEMRPSALGMGDRPRKEGKGFLSQND